MTAGSIKPLTGKHVLLICFAFFGAMLVANSFFVFYALSTLNGGESGKAYQSGLDYNRTIEAARAQDALGWSDKIEASAAGLVSIRLTDRQGAPLTGLTLAGDVARPVNEKFTRQLTFNEAEPGLYAAQTAPLDLGSWIATVTVREHSDADVVYRAKERLWLKPTS
jgi:nitrogen fixation protein FixH